ncbi:D-TA family PLP-dependent enzyme [Ahrensia kielensis]|uniref:D-TA family PLP-dependent enzyme n=1 Tax=Ahrensia kielensis TaxID=76980 RepID=A0ABU9T6S7_9HYPH
MSYDDVETPAVLIDLDIAEKNVQVFQEYCDSHALLLRPHIKTHKLPFLAEYQIAQGAIGITCQKVSEAEAMVAAGDMRDILISYNILGKERVERLRQLSQKVTISVTADNTFVVQGLSAGFKDNNKPLPVLVECNTGADRCGVATPEEAATLAEIIAKSSGLEFAGLMTYPPVGGANTTHEWLSLAKTLIEQKGLEVKVISSGGSPDMWLAHEMPLATEYRIGTYIYNDRSLVMRGTCEFTDCALTVLATVVSVPNKNRAVIDAGSKVLTSDLLGLKGHGYVLDRPDLTIDQLSEEHGRIVGNGEINLSVGEKIQIVPNHACVVSNMLDEVNLKRGTKIEGTCLVTARGKVW